MSVAADALYARPPRRFWLRLTLGWLAFWLLMFLLGAQEYLWGGGARLWQPVVDYGTAALLATVVAAVQAACTSACARTARGRPSACAPSSRRGLPSRRSSRSSRSSWSRTSSSMRSTPSLRVAHVRAVQPKGKGDAVLLMRSGAEVPCSRAHRAALLERLDGK